jgi:hypothetical protein
LIHSFKLTAFRSAALVTAILVSQGTSIVHLERSTAATFFGRPAFFCGLFVGIFHVLSLYDFY